MIYFIMLAVMVLLMVVLLYATIVKDWYQQRYPKIFPGQHVRPGFAYRGGYVEVIVCVQCLRIAMHGDQLVIDPCPACGCDSHKRRTATWSGAEWLAPETHHPLPKPAESTHA